MYLTRRNINMIRMRFFIMIIILASFSACNKDLSDDFRQYPNNAMNDTSWSANISSNAALNGILDSTLPSMMIDSINLNTADTIRFANNVELSFPANAVNNPTGYTISGKIKVEMLPLLKKGDIIRALQSTTSNGALLEIFGQVFIKLSNNGRELILAPSKSIKIRIPDTQDNPLPAMIVFKGRESTPPPPWGKDTSATWLRSNDGSTIGTWYKTGSGPNMKGYEFTTQNLRWVSGGKFADSTVPKNKLTVILPPNFTIKNTVAFAVIENSKTIVELKANYASRSFEANNIPLQKKLAIITLTKIGRDFYYGNRSINDIGNIAIYNVSPEKRSLKSILSELDKL